MELGAPLVDLGQLAQDTRQAAAARAAERLRAGADPAAVRKAAEDFEAVFLAQMLAPMFEGLGNDPLLGSGPGEDVYRSLLVQEYGRAMARSGGLGIADAVLREILALQEVAP